MMVIFIATIMQAKHEPFMDERFNHFEFISLCSSSATFFFGIFTLDAGDNGSAFTRASSLAVLVNVGYIMTALYFARLLYAEQTAIDRVTASMNGKPQHIEADQQGSVVGSASKDEHGHKDIAIELVSISNPSNPVKNEVASTATTAKGATVDIVSMDTCAAQSSVTDGKQPTSDDSGSGDPVARKQLEVKEESQLVPKPKLKQSNKRMVMATKDFDSEKPTQMTFRQGDTIELVSKPMRKWHIGRKITLVALLTLLTPL